MPLVWTKRNGRMSEVRTGKPYTTEQADQEGMRAHRRHQRQAHLMYQHQQAYAQYQQQQEATARAYAQYQQQQEAEARAYAQYQQQQEAERAAAAEERARAEGVDRSRREAAEERTRARARERQEARGEEKEDEPHAPYEPVRVGNVEYYKVLGISPNATRKEISNAYKKLALQLHPDKNKDDPDAKAKFQRVAEAYDILTRKGSGRSKRSLRKTKSFRKKRSLRKTKSIRKKRPLRKTKSSRKKRPLRKT